MNTTKRTRTLGFLAIALVSLPIVALLLPVLSVFLLALLTLLLPVLVMLAPVVVIAPLYFLLRGKAIPAVSDAGTPSLRALNA
jgi:hypothetical protein